MSQSVLFFDRWDEDGFAGFVPAFAFGFDGDCCFAASAFVMSFPAIDRLATLKAEFVVKVFCLVLLAAEISVVTSVPPTYNGPVIKALLPQTMLPYKEPYKTL